MIIRRIRWLILLSTILLSQIGFTVFAEDFGLISGPNHIYALIIPANWKMNREYARKIGFPAPYYLNPVNAKDTRTYIYSIGHETSSQPLQDFVNLSQKRIQEAVGKLTIVKKDTVQTKDKTTAFIYHYTGYSDKRVEDVAFLKTKSLICVIAFSTRDMTNYKAYYEDFSRVVKSFYFVSDSPQNLNMKESLK